MKKLKRLSALILAALLIPLQGQAQVVNGGPRGSYPGLVSRGTYAVSVTGAALTAVSEIISLEASEGKGFRVTKVCIQPGSATTAAYTLWQLIRTTTASTGGTLIANEATSGAATVTKFYASDVSWAGLARRADGTEGTSGAILDQGMVFVGTATTDNGGVSCVEYCGPSSTMCPTVEPGIVNGVKLMFTGTAGGASQAATIYFVSE